MKHIKAISIVLSVAGLLLLAACDKTNNIVPPIDVSRLYGVWTNPGVRETTTTSGSITFDSTITYAHPVILTFDSGGIFTSTGGPSNVNGTYSILTNQLELSTTGGSVSHATYLIDSLSAHIMILDQRATVSTHPMKVNDLYFTYTK